ncbi:Uu.00g053440.m01.CDS01 [Anthostomella pinea]|uniref:Uu.00g053440.m01.CDS01 n=1 Tax=Anthostomella pinea TaxID=933095 RepID=A0AAI8VX56_9PEZI|nr:Uu.00g053440.m01.CDS01 [Anthostomella pinea]
MADEVERLAIAPFREIVDKGRTAVENAQGTSEDVSAPMLKAAQNLVKEGERALRRIEPLCTKSYDEYGATFIDAIKENDEIAQYRSELEDLLWDFDDFIEVDEFDAAKFDELQKSSRKAAPKIVDILKRMKLVATATAPPSVSSQPSRAVSTPPDESAAHARQEPSATSIVLDPPPSATDRLMEEAERQLSSMMGAVAGPDPGFEGEWGPHYPSRPTNHLDRSTSHHSDTSETPSEPPPEPPSADPWQVGRPPPTGRNGHPAAGNRWERRPLLAEDSPTIPQTYPVTSHGEPTGPLRLRKFDEGYHDDPDQRMRASSQSLGTDSSEGSRSPLQSHRWTNSTHSSSDSMRLPAQAQRSHSGFPRSNRSPSHSNENPGWPGKTHDAPASQAPSDTSSVLDTPSIPENSAVNTQGNLSPRSSLSNNSNFPSRTASVTKQNSHVHSSKQPSTESVNSSVFDVVDCANPTSPVTPGHRNSLQSTTSSTPSNTYSTSTQPPAYPGHPPVYEYSGGGPNRSPGTTIRNHSSSTLTVQPNRESFQYHHGPDEGLIPVDMEDPMFREPSMPLREPDCGIGPFSSFYKLKGFCKGAEEAMRGQLGFKKIKRPVGGFSMALVAKCNHCLYELDYKSVEQDMNNEPGASFTANGIGFRLRVLQKSHLQVRHVDEQMYGCIFCVHENRTVEESDATVFFNQRQLFAHMARHPRPLPDIAGVTILKEPELTPNARHNFDLHFPHPSVQSVMTGLSREIARLPTAVATETRKTQNGVMRTPPDRTPVLHFALGAKIVGIEFPLKYEGKWGIGWHDGLRAAFEVDAVQIDAPPKGEVKMQGTSNVQAVARWKWSQKGDEQWLKFDKGDVIKNIAWAYADHWCWSGTTAKGWGVFPQSHLDPNSIRTTQPGDASSVSSWEKKGPLWFSLRKNNNADRKLASPVVGNPPSSLIASSSATRPV